MSTLSTTVRRGLVVTAAAVAAGPVVGGIACAATGPTTSASPLGKLPLAGGLTQGLPLADGLGGLSGGLSNLGSLPVAGPTLTGLTANVMPSNGMVGQLTGQPPASTAAPATALTPAPPAAPAMHAPAPAAAPAVHTPAPAAAPAAHAPVPAHPATRSRKAMTPPHAPATPNTLAPGAMAGPKLLSGMPMVDTPLGPDAPSVSDLPQYAGVRNMSELSPTLAAAQAKNLAAPPSLPVLGQLPTGGLTQNLPLAGGLQGLPLAGGLSGLGGLGGVTGLLGRF